MTASIPTLLCRRDAQGQVVALTREALDPAAMQAGGWEPADPGDPAVATFLQSVTTAETRLNQTDAGMGRVTEDLIDVLIDRGVIQFTDLPLAAQAKLLERRRSRAEVAHRLSLATDEGEIPLL